LILAYLLLNSVLLASGVSIMNIVPNAEISDAVYCVRRIEQLGKTLDLSNVKGRPPPLLPLGFEM